MVRVLFLGGLIGYITGSNGAAISADKINQYIEGSSSVIVVYTGYNKENNWGLLVGSPNAGNYVEPGDSGESDNPGSTEDDTSTVYVVNIYEMKDGEYDTSSPSSSSEYVALVGSTVTAYYSLSEGYTLDESKSPESSLTKKIESADTKIVFNVFLRNKYTITFKSDGTTVGTFTGIYGTTIEMPDVPEKPGYDIVGWIPDLPSKVPAKDLTVTALWGKIDPIFTIVIPSSLVMLEEDGCKGSMTLDVTVNQISSIGTLSISVRSGNNFHLFLKNHEAYNLPYEDYALQYFLYVGSSDNPVVQDGEIGRYTHSPTPPYHTSLKLNAEMPGKPKYAGDYEDLLTFTVKYTETI